jgi:ATP-dependent RNA helicase DDX56/DBP9
MKFVPKYLLPRTATLPGTEAEEGGSNKATGFVPFRKNASRGRGRGRGRGKETGGSRSGKKNDSLKKFSR